jgi:hypothetical protein
MLYCSICEVNLSAKETYMREVAVDKINLKNKKRKVSYAILKRFNKEIVCMYCAFKIDRMNINREIVVILALTVISIFVCYIVNS